MVDLDCSRVATDSCRRSQGSYRSNFSAGDAQCLPPTLAHPTPSFSLTLTHQQHHTKPQRKPTAPLRDPQSLSLSLSRCPPPLKGKSIAPTNPSIRGLRHHHHPLVITHEYPLHYLELGRVTLKRELTATAATTTIAAVVCPQFIHPSTTQLQQQQQHHPVFLSPPGQRRIIILSPHHHVIGCIFLY
jgi:hypothetical protein